MKTRKWLSLVMIVVLTVLSFSGCGSSGIKETISSSEDVLVQADNSETSTGSNETADEVDLSKQEPYTVKVLMFDDGGTDLVNEVAAAASEITKAKFNTTIEIERVGFGSWAQQVQLTLTSGEKLDLFPILGLNAPLTTLVSNGQIVPMTESLKNGVGLETYNMVDEEDWVCTTVKGEIYGIPMNKGKQNVYGAACNKDIADELGIDLDAVKTFDDFENVLAIVKRAYPEMYPLASNNQDIRVMIPSDTLGDNRDCVLGAIVDATTGSTKVENLYASDAYREFVERMYEWAQKGYIAPDAVSNTDSGTSLIRAGSAFCDFYTGPAPDTAARLSRECGVTIKDVEFYEHYKTTAETAPCWSIAGNSENPERAMQILNEMYTNQELANILIYGIEGKTFEFVDKANKVINYPEGVDAANAGYAFDHWGWPNMQLSYIWEGYPADVYQQYAEFNSNGKLSPAYGFTFENSSVINEVTACTNVVSKYAKALNTGSINPNGSEAFLDQFNKELKENGIDTILAEKQSQLDEWLAKK